MSINYGLAPVIEAIHVRDPVTKGSVGDSQSHPHVQLAEKPACRRCGTRLPRRRIRERVADYSTLCPMRMSSNEVAPTPLIAWVWWLFRLPRISKIGVETPVEVSCR